SDLLGDRDDDPSFEVAHHAAQKAPSTRVDKRLHVVEQPGVGACRAVEPGRMVEAHHALRVALEVQRPATDARPVGGEAEQRGVQVLVIRQLTRNTEPHPMGRLARTVCGWWSRSDMAGDPRPWPLFDGERVTRRDGSPG